MVYTLVYTTHVYRLAKCQFWEIKKQLYFYNCLILKVVPPEIELSS